MARQPVAAIAVDEDAGGLMPNRRYRAVLADGTRVFVKEAVDDFTEHLLEREQVVYESLRGRSFLPRFMGRRRRTLVLEDLRPDVRWLPPWRTGDLALVLDVLDEVAATPAPAELPSLANSALLRKWRGVAEEPQPFLELRMCTGDWLDQVIDRLVASDESPLTGSALVHGDVRSDNLCIRGGAVVFDWGAAARGRPDYDLVNFAMSFASETGIPPEHVASDADPNLVAVLAGTLAYHAPHRAVPLAVREQLRTHLAVAFPWCIRALALPPTDLPVA